MYKSIETKYYGPGSVKSSRIRVRCAARTIFVPYDDSMSTDNNHILAAKQLAMQMGWTGLYYGGENVDEDGFVFVVSTYKQPTFSVSEMELAK